MDLEELVLVLQPRLNCLARPVARLLVRAHATRVQSRIMAASMRRSIDLRMGSIKRSVLRSSDSSVSLADGWVGWLSQRRGGLLLERGCCSEFAAVAAEHG